MSEIKFVNVGDTINIGDKAYRCVKTKFWDCLDRCRLCAFNGRKAECHSLKCSGFDRGDCVTVHFVEEGGAR